MLTIKYFTATWCAPCRAFGPIVDQVTQQYANKVNLVKIDIETNEREVFGYSIVSVPTMVTLLFVCTRAQCQNNNFNL
jgi:thioredoxin 1